jgi:hypothetical protein
MRIIRSASYCLFALSLFLAASASSQAPSKSAVKSITVYKTPT